MSASEDVEEEETDGGDECPWDDELELRVEEEYFKEAFILSLS